MIQIIETITTEPYLYITLALAIVGVLAIGYIIINLLFGSKKKEIGFDKLEEEIDIGYDGLQRAAESFHTFSDVINEVKKNAQR